MHVLQQDCHDRFVLSQASVPRACEGELLVQLSAASVHGTCAEISVGILGRVVAVGLNVPAWRLGDIVIGNGVFANGSTPERASTKIAEFVTLPALEAITLPEKIEHLRDMALVPAFYAAAEARLTWGRLYRDETVLILGPDEGIGPACVELAKLRGAKVVADPPPTRGGPSVGLMVASDCAKVDLILDCRVGEPSSAKPLHVLKADGLYVLGSGVVLRQDGSTVPDATLPANPIVDEVERTMRLVAEDHLVLPEVERCVPSAFAETWKRHCDKGEQLPLLVEFGS